MHLNVDGVAVDAAIAAAARERVLAAATQLSELAPVQALWVQRYVQQVIITELRTQRHFATTKGLVLAASFATESQLPALALVLLSAAVQARLARVLGGRGSPDTRAQYWRRVHIELDVVARRFDQAEDPSGYVPGVSQGRWEQWVDSWLRGAALRRPNVDRRVRGLARDLRRLGAPRWIVRLFALSLRWRWRAV